MEFVVLIACLYGKGCEEAAHATYLSSPTLRQEVEYAQQTVENNLGKKSVTTLGMAGLFLSNRAWTYKITNNLLLKGEHKWEDVSLSYQYYF